MREVQQFAKTDDATPLATAAAAAVARYASIDSHINGSIDVAELANALQGSMGTTWSITTGGSTLALLHGDTFEVPGQTTRAWTGIDGWHATSARDLAALLGAATPVWRRQGAREHRVWVPACLDWSPWSEQGYAPWRSRATIALPYTGDAVPVGQLSVRGVEAVDVALYFDALIDQAQGLEGATVPDSTRSEMVAMLQDPDATYYQYRINDDVIGQCLTFAAPPVRGSHPNTVVLSEVGIDPRWQRHGHGRAMITALLQQRTAHDAYADVYYRASNLGAVAFWEALGFRPTLIQLRKVL